MDVSFKCASWPEGHEYNLREHEGDLGRCASPLSVYSLASSDHNGITRMPLLYTRSGWRIMGQRLGIKVSLE